jgi:protein-tyrosine phosphatase
MNEVETAARRRIALVRPYNMRDLGGVPLVGGRSVRRRAVFRAGGLHHLEGEDLGTVRDLGLRTLVDLRSPGELARHGGPAPELASQRLHFPMIPEIWDLRPLEDTESVEEYFVERYLEMLELGAEAIAETLALLARPDSYPVGFFCAAGKDRTGVMTAVLLRLLGAEDEAIVGDYALSGPEIARLLAEVGDRERWATERMAGGAPRLLTAPPTVMRSFLAALPDADELARTFRLTPAARRALRELLVAGQGPSR